MCNVQFCNNAVVYIGFLSFYHYEKSFVAEFYSDEASFNLGF
jgi:hypothetical protein